MRVKGGMSVRNGMWHDLRDGIIMTDDSNLCGMTISIFELNFNEVFSERLIRNVLEIFDICLEL